MQVDRRTFVRGTAGMVGMGALAGISTKLGFAREGKPRENAKEPQMQANQADVEIPVTLVEKRQKPSNPKKYQLSCPDAEAENGDTVRWYGHTEGLTILLVQFKGGRSPFAEIDLPNPSAANNRVRNTADHGRYGYLVVASHTANGQTRTYALDPDLDIVG